jgi:Flp pilus assembly protein TadD
VGGCASGAPTLTQRFVRQGTPTVEIAPGLQPPATPATTLLPGIQEVSRVSPIASDVDRQDPGLRRALADVQRLPALTTHVAVANEYHRLGIFDQALDHLEHAAKFETDSAAVNDGLARVWRDAGRPGIGLSYAYRAIHSAPRSATPRHTLGTLLFALGNRAAAERAFREAVSLEPLAWYGWLNLCKIAMQDGRTVEATTLCQRATAARRQLPKAPANERH